MHGNCLQHRQLGLGNGGEAVSVDKGHCHITVPKVEMVVSLDTIGRDTRSLLQRMRGRLPNKVFCIDILHRVLPNKFDIELSNLTVFN